MKRIQLEPWTTWEKLCLANAVQRTGDQNWTAVGRAVKNIYDDTMMYLGNEARPAHWFSMKQCAAQYETLLNSVLGSRRKKRTDKSADPHEQPSHLIYNILKNEFLEELDRKIEDDRVMYKKMKKKQEDILNGLYDDKLEDMLAEDAKEKERDIKLKLKFKLGEKNAERNTSPIKSYTPTTPENEVVKPPGSNSSTSPLLTSLLQSPSQHSLPPTPTISLLLNSTPSNPTNESPTLSKLLESPSSKVPLNAPSSHLASSLHGLSSVSSSSLDLFSHLDNASSRSVSRPTLESPRRSTTPHKPTPPLPHSSDGIHSEIVIEEELHHTHDKKQLKKSDNELEDEEEVIESVEEILEKLKEAITETVCEDNDQVVVSEQVRRSDVSVEHVWGLKSATRLSKDKVEEEGEEVNTEEEEIDRVKSFREETEEDSDEKQEEADTPSTQPTSSAHDDKVFTDDEKIDADILAEAKSVVNRRMSDSEVQELNDLVQVANSKSIRQRHMDERAVVIENDRETDDQVELDALDQEAVEIIVMGSTSNSVINVLSQDSSSEDVTQASTSNQEGDGMHHDVTSDHEATSSSRVGEEEDDDEEEKPATTPLTPSVGGEEDSESSGETMVDKMRQEVIYEESGEGEEEKEEECWSKEERGQYVEDSSSKDDHASSDHVSSRDECGDSSSVPDTLADQETTSDSVPNQPLSPPSIPISSRENLPEVKITLEPLEITLSQPSYKEDMKNSSGLEKIRRQSSRKRSSAHLDSKPSSPMSFMDDEKEYRAWKKSVLLVYSRIASHKYASVFSKPITDTAGYKALIKCPMDLSTIKRNIETGVIRSTLDFQRDVMLMIQNAVIYNSHDSPVYSMALEMWNDVISQMNIMVQAVGDGVVLGEPTVQGDTPGRPSRHAKLSFDNKKSGHTPPTHATSKRRKWQGWYSSMN